MLQQAIEPRGGPVSKPRRTGVDGLILAPVVVELKQLLSAR